MSKSSRWINRRKYQLAREMIQKGAWIVDPDAGLIVSAHTGRAMAQKPGTGGYHRVAVYDPETKRPYTALVSRIIWESQHGEIPDGLEVNHKSGDKSDNRMANFELLTQPENIRHCHETGLWPSVIRSSRELDIAAALEAGKTNAQVAAEFGVGTGTVHRVNVRRPDYVPSARVDPDASDKTCSECLQVKPLDQFNRRSAAADGRDAACGPCSSKRQLDRARLAGASPKRRVTEAQKAEILRLLSEGLTQYRVADLFSISQSTVSVLNARHAKLEEAPA